MPFLTQAKTNWKFLLIVIVLAIIVGGGIWGYLQMTEKEFEIPPVDILERVIGDETVDWLTYRNEEYGFEVKYPEDFEEYGYEKKSDSFSAQSKKTRYSIHINVVTGKSSFREYLLEIEDIRAKAYGGGPSVTVLRKQEMNILDKPAMHQEIQSLAATLPGIETFIDITPKMIISISVRGGDWDSSFESLRELNNQILSTFRFIEEREIDKCKNIQDSYQRKICISTLAISSNDPSLCEEITESKHREGCFASFGIGIGKNGSCELCDGIQSVIAKRYCMLQVTAISEAYKFCGGLDINIEDFFKKYTDGEFRFSFYYPVDNELRISENEISFSYSDDITVEKKEADKGGYLFFEYMPAGGAVVPWTSYTFYDDKGECVNYFREYQEDWDTNRREIVEKEEDNPGETEMPPVGHHINNPGFYTVSGLPVFPQYVRWSHYNIVCLYPDKFLNIRMGQSGELTFFLDAFTKTITRTDQDVEDKKNKKALVEEFLAHQMLFFGTPY